MNLKKGTIQKTFVLCLMLIFSLNSTLGCKESKTGIDLSPFIQLARNAECADIRNRLFLIDDELVLSDRVGNCADAGYIVILFGSTVDTVLCKYHDSIAGPVKEIYNESYRAMFDTIIDNLDKSDLGLGSNHTVTEIHF
jgi:hypothetical protein